ncbi:nucleoside deaminase [Gryllotalpicola kribbensis]|jgi:guanine deaminase|uniref:Nucleoside deaminase n=1 Tax=Gryllotalpicola kribbensis TaxID=993084 RepID=A0ABP8AJM7_9MICO
MTQDAAAQLRRADDLYWLGAAVRLAEQNVRDGGGPFGAIVVKDGQQVAVGQNRVTRDNDPTAHAEVEAIRAAGRALGTFDLSGTILYSSCEPCPLCLSAGLWGRVERIVFSANKMDAAAAGFDDHEFYELMATPRDGWTLPVVQELRTADASEPFELWGRFDGRVRY